MSLEDSMKTLAESNLKLAAAMDSYAATIEKFGSMVVAQPGDAPAAATEKAAPAEKAPAKKAAAKKAAAKKAEPETQADDAGLGDDDGFGGEGGEAEVPEKLTGDQVKAKLLEVRDAYGDKAPALKIINDLGYNAIPDVKAADYQKVWAACEKAIADAP